jgi:hypothetical protein
LPDNPYAQYANKNPFAVYGSPRTPPPQTPAQSQQDQLQVAHLGQQIEQVPLQNANTRVNIEQGQASIHNQTFNQNQGLRQEYNNLPEVKNYSVALQSLGTALKAPDSPQGDLAVIYAYAKAADPGSVVREGEMDMANATASLPQQYQAAAQRLTQGKRLPPEVRTGLIETMRQSVGGMRQVYDQQRGRYSSLAQRAASTQTRLSASRFTTPTRSRKQTTSATTAARPATPTPPKPRRCHRSKRKALTSRQIRRRPRAARTSATNCSRRCTRSRSSRPPTSGVPGSV